MATSKRKSFIEKLRHIEDQLFDLGNAAGERALATGNRKEYLNSIGAYRGAMQAMRDEARYFVIVKKVEL